MKIATEPGMVLNTLKHGLFVFLLVWCSFSEHRILESPCKLTLRGLVCYFWLIVACISFCILLHVFSLCAIHQ